MEGSHQLKKLHSRGSFSAGKRQSGFNKELGAMKLDDQILEEKSSLEEDDDRTQNGYDSQDDEADNPFNLPSDDQIFLMRDKERENSKKQRERFKNMTIWEKTKEMSSRGLARRKQINSIPTNSSVTTNQTKKQLGLVTAASAAISNERRREKENMSDFITKKREMFLVQMSLDTKREEIRKLEEKAQLKEEALKKSELMLEEDAIRFDTFLKENDKKAHEAIKRAEAETKAKQEKVQEIKRLNHQIQAVQSDMSKLKEQLEDCLKYKAFLDGLTPLEWFQEQRETLEARKQEKRNQKRNAIMKEYEEEKQRLIHEYELLKKQEEDKRRASGKPSANKLPPLKLPDPPNFDDEEKHEEKHADEEKDSFDEEELPMYFKKPNQLLDIFTQLEESNLFLIQNSQETEQALEELKQDFRETKLKMDIKTESLKQNIDELQQQISVEEEKARLLEERMRVSTGEDAQEGLLRQLNEKVKEVYKKCGFDCDASPATLTMLTDLEAKLEDLLGQIEQMPEEYVIKEEKLREKERRERVRTERMAQQQKTYEERLRKSMERSMQAPKKKTGKPVMFRSAPPQKKERKKDNSKEEEKLQDEKEFLSW